MPDNDDHSEVRFAALLRRASLGAAIAYHLEGIDAARRIQDPMGDEPVDIRESERDGRVGIVIISAMEDKLSGEMFFTTKTD